MTTKIIKGNKNKVYLKYNEHKYKVSYKEVLTEDKINPLKYSLTITRLSDNEIVMKMEEHINFLIECDTDNPNFIISCINNKERNIYHYIDLGRDSLICGYNFSCENIKTKDIHIKDNLYLIKSSDGFYLYNLYSRSPLFEEIYSDPKFFKLFRKHLIIVKEKIFNDNKTLSDTLIYGINTHNYRIETSIWSNLQQRWINICSYLNLENMKKYSLENNNNFESFNNEKMTIVLEVKKYLEILPNYLFDEEIKTIEQYVSKYEEDEIKSLKREK